MVTATQSGYALGLIFLVPLGDCVNRKKLVIIQLLLSVLALITAAVAPDLMTLLCAMLLVGLMAVVTQLMVAWAAMLASPEQRGQVVGSVTSGIVIGILLARFVSGMIADLAGWRAVYLTAACLLLLISLILAKVLPATAGQTRRTSYPHLLLSVFRLFLTEPQLRRRGILALLILQPSVCSGLRWYCHLPPCHCHTPRPGCSAWPDLPVRWRPPEQAHGLTWAWGSVPPA